MRVSKSFSHFIDLQQLECHPANVYLAVFCFFLLKNVSSECPGRYVLATSYSPIPRKTLCVCCRCAFHLLVSDCKI